MKNIKNETNEELELLKEYLNETQKTVFNIPEDKLKELIGDNFNSTSKDKLNKIADCLYKPQNVIDNYKPQKRGYVRHSEDWELKKNDIDNITLTLKN